MKRVILLGASGSIGQNTLDVISHHLEDFNLVGISVHSKTELIPFILDRFPSIESVAISGKIDLDKTIKVKYPKVNFIFKEDAISSLLKLVNYDLLVNALSGFAGLKPSLIAIEQNKIIALSNKETLVVGGNLVLDALKKSQAKIYPIDSEHAAMHHLLSRIPKEEVKDIYITCSGGALRDYPLDKLDKVTPMMALNHPRWKMGAKITIDSATLLNKAYEVIEAHYLFGFDLAQIHVLMHKESIIHALVNLLDHSYIAHLGTSDMRTFIQYAMFEGKSKILFDPKPFDFEDLHFFKKDDERYPMFHIVLKAFKKGGSSMALVNAASEVLDQLFLENRIKFTDIARIVSELVNEDFPILSPTYQDLEKVDEETRIKVLRKVGL